MSGRPSDGRPLTSVIINNHDYGRFVGAAIDSALAQTYPAVEVLVVDDGSQDCSGDVLAGYTDRATVLFQPNRGQAAACNAGYERSKGEVVVFLDADDMLLPDTVAAAVAAMTPGTAKVHWPERIIDACGRPRGVFPVLPLASGDLRPTVLHDGPLSFSSAPMSGNAFPRQVLDEILPIPEADYRICADSYLNTMSVLHGEVDVLDRVHGCRRVHGGNYTCQPLDAHLAAALAIWRRDCRWARVRLARAGVAPGELGDWEANPFVSEMRRLAGALRDIERCTRPGDPVVFVGPPTDGRDAVTGRPTRLLDRRAATTAGALAAIERLAAADAAVLAVTWTAFAWLAQDGLRVALDDLYPRRVATDDVVVFGLTA